MIKIIKNTIREVEAELSSKQIQAARNIINNDDAVLLTHTPDTVLFSITNGKKEVEIYIRKERGGEKEEDEEETITLQPLSKKKKNIKWDEYAYCALLLLKENCHWLDEGQTGRRYTREGMIRRVKSERQDKAKAANYKVKLADNIHGEHILYNEKGTPYKITIWDFEKKIGYINNVDWRVNKLGTTKHIMFLLDYLKNRPRKFKKLKKEYPFIEITLDPLNDYRISWIYPHKLDKDSQSLLNKYFGNKQYIEDARIASFLSFLNEARRHDNFRIRPEVQEKIESFFNRNLIENLKTKYKPDYSTIKAELFPYQKQGVEFALFREGAIIADEMGLGKTLQAITIAKFKKDIFDFKKTLIICPASIKHQWKSEIEKFSDETALIVEGLPKEREGGYINGNDYFHIINYETVLRDLTAINKGDYDFVILDEAQKIKNYETKTAAAIKKINKKQSLIITGTPIENKLIDLFSIVQFVDPYFLSPLWEFSYQHCIFYANSKNRIAGYYNLSSLKKRMDEILIRREKKEVLKQLPNLTQEDVYVQLHEEQAFRHAGYSRGIAQILRKKFKTTYDWQRLMLLLSNMRMVSDSTFLIDKETNYSPKLTELKHILVDKLDLRNSKRKIIIFSEWINMLHLIGEMLKENGLGFVMLTGKVPVKKRGKLIEHFENDDDCRIFLSTESGGSGLNLQIADTVINFELPWNPAKKNQRIGRIDRLGQKNHNLTVFNLISVGSIEQKIASGLFLKQNLFEGVLNQGVSIDSVDFSEKGRAQFIQQLEEIIEDSHISGTQVVDAEIEPGNISMAGTEEERNEEDGLPEPIMENETAASNKNAGGNHAESPATVQKEEQFQQLEQVLNKGMEFLSGIYQMTTGDTMNTSEGQKIEIDKKTGEVVIRFKMKL